MSSESESSDTTEISTIGTCNWNLLNDMNLEIDSDANSQDSMTATMTASQVRDARNLILLQEVHNAVINPQQPDQLDVDDETTQELQVAANQEPQDAVEFVEPTVNVDTPAVDSMAEKDKVAPLEDRQKTEEELELLNFSDRSRMRCHHRT